jgi:hypothetical protein
MNALSPEIATFQDVLAEQRKSELRDLRIEKCWLLMTAQALGRPIVASNARHPRKAK